MSHRTTPTPAALHCVLGGLEEMLSIRMSGNPAPKQTHRDLKHMDQQFTSTSPISTGFLREKKPQTTHNQHAEFHMDTNKAAEDSYTSLCLSKNIVL